jgi:hypothetical protein
MKSLSLRAAMAAIALYLACCVIPAQAAEPLLTILFTGNTYGNYEPCPS